MGGSALLVGGAHLVARRALAEVEVLDVHALGLDDLRLDQRVVRASPVDPSSDLERLLELVCLARAEDALPAVEAVEPLVRRVPEGHVLGIRARSPAAAEIREQDFLGVVARPAVLSMPCKRVERLERDARPAADVLDVDQRAAHADPPAGMVSTCCPKLDPSPWVE